MRYPVVLHTDNGKSYGATVPDLLGCFSSGDTIDEALTSAVQAIDLHLEGLVESGYEIPRPGEIATRMADPWYVDGVWALVDVDTARFEGRATKINITLPKYVLARIDKYVQARNLTRSGFLAEAACQAMLRNPPKI